MRGADTNDLGEYRAVDLPADRYYVCAQEFNGPPTLDRSKEQYVPVYYPGATDSAGAAPVDLVAGAQVSIGDLMLIKAQVVTVKGKVVVELTGAQGLPRVGFDRNAGHDRIQEIRGTVNVSGEFVARGLTSGTYVAGASIAKGGTWHVSPALTLNVGQTNIEGLVFTIGENLSIAGRIRIDGDTQGGLEERPREKSESEVPSMPAKTGTIGSARTGPSRLDNLRPDRYGIVVADLPSGYYTKGIYVGESEITYTGTEVRNGSAPIDIVVSPKAGLVAGVVQSADAGKPAQGATVVMIPQEKERVPIPECYQQSTTDQYGRFAFKSVAPGKYKVYAWEDVEPTAWMDSQFMKPLLGIGETVTVEESGRAEVAVTVIPANSEKEKR
ncbi:MAG: carboxypeptidase-like regulatory domain-containing protein [Ignavibacteriota bacterium]